ncbi:MAG: hypothetical protein ACI8V2_005382 [Candidatus Latescibacterota bacterium]|jgi:hypothetical protein
MISSKLFHEHQVAAGDHVRIWQSEDGNVFEHILPTGHSITIRCRTLDEARYLMAQLVHDDSGVDFQSPQYESLDSEGEQCHEGL